MLVGCITIRNCNRIVKKSNTYRSTTRIDCLRYGIWNWCNYLPIYEINGIEYVPMSQPYIIGRYELTVEFHNGARYCYYGKTKTVETIGGQITSYEANKENLPRFLEKPVKESFKKYGFCMWKTPEYECIIYPTLQAAQHAIQWTIEN